MTDPVVQTRAAARAAADRAIAAWVQATFDDVASFADRVGVAGPDRLVVFAARPGSAELFDDEQAELGLVTVAGPHRVVTLSRDGGQDLEWAEAVALWSDLRDAEATSLAAEMPVSLAAAPDDRLLAGYEALHCAVHGPMPALLAEVGTDTEPADDPFTALLADSDDDWDDMGRRFEELFARYRLTPPGDPDPSSCSNDEGDAVG